MIFCKITNKNVIKATHSSGIWKKVAKNGIEIVEKSSNFTIALMGKNDKKALKHRNISVGTEIVIIFAAKKEIERKTL